MGYQIEQNGVWRVRIRSDAGTRRKYLSIPIGKVGEISAAERLRKQIEIAQKFNSEEHLKSVCNTEHTFKKQALLWSGQLKKKPATVTSALCTLEHHVFDVIGDMPLSEVRNGAMRLVIEKVAREGGSLPLMDQCYKFIKMVKASAVTDDLEELYPYKFNKKRIFEACGIDRKAYKPNQPCPTSEQVTAMIETAEGWLRVFLITAAATGMRFGELLALKIENFDDNKIQIEQSIWRGTLQEPKTQNAKRAISLHPSIGEILQNFIGDRKEGFIFPARHQGAVTYKLYALQDAVGAEKAGVHSFRRFRTTWLRKQRVFEDLIRYWLGHAGKSITDGYSKIREDSDFCQAEATKAGYGFELPKSIAPAAPGKTDLKRTEDIETEMIAAA